MTGNQTFNQTQGKQILTFGKTVLGAVLFAAGQNLFTIPLGLYSGGFMGISQLLRTLFVYIFHVPFGQTDIAGIICFLLNLPLFYLAWSRMGKNFFMRTIITVVIQTVAFTVIPIPVKPIIEEYFTSCIVGGIVAGGGAGLVLRSGSSGGGQDILGVYFTERYPKISVGKVSLAINFFVYGICLLLFDVETVIYCLIYGAVYSFACDYMHIQNINMSVTILTDNPKVSDAIFAQTGRVVTDWPSTKGSCGKSLYVLLVVISKDEEKRLKKIVKDKDEDAFMIFNEGCFVAGKFEKRLYL